MSKYFTQDIIKDAPHREAYYKGIQQFLKQKSAQAQTARQEYMTGEKLVKNSQSYRNDFINMLGFPLNEYKESDKKITAQQELVGQDEKVTIYRLTLETIENLQYSGLLLVPKNYNQNSPLVIAFHGGLGTPELASGFFWQSANYNNLVRRATDKGAVVFAPQNLLWDKVQFGGEYDRAVIDSSLKQLGGSITAFELYNVRKSLDYLLLQGYGAGKNIYSIGLSYGGMFALYLGAIDLRIKAVLSSCFFNDRLKYNWTDWAFKNQANTFNDAQVAALVAPRKLYIEVADEDELFQPQGAIDEHIDLQKYYAAYNAQDKLKFKVFKGKHELDKESQGYDFIFNT